MDLQNATEPQQGATYDELVAVARKAEELAFDGFFRSDHYLFMGDSPPRPGLTDAWITLAGIARQTTTIKLGTLVSSATFRLPGPLAVTVAQVDQMSGGRIEFGIGAGWYEGEHSGFGIPFPGVKQRFDRLEEQLAVITGIWGSDGTFSFSGDNYAVENAPSTAHPGRRIPIIIGGGGKTRTPALAAQYGDEFNAAFDSVERSAQLFARVAEVSSRPLINSVAQVVCVGRNAGELARRAAAIGRDLDELRSNGLAGSPAEVVDRLGRFADVGATRVYLQVLDVTDLDQLELLAGEVAPHV